jgi:hypothetical protein
MRLTLMMEAVSSSGTSVSFYQTTRLNIPDESHFINSFHSAASGRTSDRIGRRLSAGLQRLVDWCEFENVSEVCTASIFRAFIASLQEAATQKTAIFVLIALRTSSHTQIM